MTLAAAFFSFTLALGYGACDSLEVQRATSLGAWTPALAYSESSATAPAPHWGTFQAGDTAKIWVSQSTATQTRCAYRVRCWHAGRAGSWSPVLPFVTGASPDSLYGAMTLDGRCLSGWAFGLTPALRPPVASAWRSDSTMRAVTYGDARKFWWSHTLALFGIVK